MVRSVGEVHRVVSTSLGMIQFPIGTEESRQTSEHGDDELGDHIMGVTVIAWLTRFPIERWGEAWARHGSFDIRFRAHLTAGLELVLTVEPTEDAMDLIVAGIDGQVYATAAAARRGPAALSTGDHDRRSALAPAARARPVDDELRDRVLTPLQFAFDASRDLAFTAGLADETFWRDRRWAHPAWVASAGNAIVRRNVAFPEPAGWLHAGLQLRLHRPVAAGALIEVDGSITELFASRRHRFAVATLRASVDGESAMTMRNTFAYATTSDADTGPDLSGPVRTPSSTPS